MRARIGGTAHGQEDLAKPVERVRLAGPGSQFPECRQRLMQMARGLLMIALPRAGEAQVHQRECLAHPVTELADQGQAALQAVGGALASVAAQVDEAERAEDLRLAVPVAQLAEQAQRLLLVVGSQVMMAKPHVA